jgi:hypothetical protein
VERVLGGRKTGALDMAVPEFHTRSSAFSRGGPSYECGFLSADFRVAGARLLFSAMSAGNSCFDLLLDTFND